MTSKVKIFIDKEKKKMQIEIGLIKSNSKLYVERPLNSSKEPRLVYEK